MKLKPLHTTTIFEFYTPDYSTEMDLPFVDAGISAGFPHLQMILSNYPLT